MENSVSDALDLAEIHVVCLSGDLDALQTLEVTQGLDIRTTHGETPLMLAALFGHVHIVMFLLEKGASISATDHSGNKAINFASSTSLFTSMRRSVYNKNGFMFGKTQAKLYCLHAIADLLAKPRFGHQPKSNRYSNIPSIRATSLGIEVYEKIASIITPGRDPRKKTVGYIHTAANPSPRMFAISGFSNVASRPTLLSGHKWTQIALSMIAPIIGHKFERYFFDQAWEVGELDPTKHGRFFASHSEVLLSTWYVISLVAALKGITILRNNKKTLSKYLRDLADEHLGDAGHAIIELDQRPCESCGLYLKALTKVTRVKFEVVSRRRLVLTPKVDKKWPWRMFDEVNTEDPDENPEPNIVDPLLEDCDIDGSYTVERELSDDDMIDSITQDEVGDDIDELFRTTSNSALVKEKSKDGIEAHSSNPPRGENYELADQEVDEFSSWDMISVHTTGGTQDNETAAMFADAGGIFKTVPETILEAADLEDHFSNASEAQLDARYDMWRRSKELERTIQNLYEYNVNSSGNGAAGASEDFNYALDKVDRSYVGRTRKRSLSRASSESSLSTLDNEITDSPATEPSSSIAHFFDVDSEIKQPHKRKRSKDNAKSVANLQDDRYDEAGGPFKKIDLSSFLFDRNQFAATRANGL